MRLAVTTALFLTFALPAHAATPVTVMTQSGPVSGVAGDGFNSFKGIPYAAPPVGALRWQKPQPVAKWTAALDASDFGPSCVQPNPPSHVLPGSPALKMSEDCLRLNVWAPPGAKKAPVMVWIHGGGNQNGSTADFFMDGQNIAKDGVILISMNYRLGTLGFFSHPALGETANFGIWDQIAALKWVRDNVAAFGGDPDNVTLFGESAGGEDVLVLMASPAAKGLFAKAIAESAGGGWGPNATIGDLQKTSVQIATKLSLPNATADQLRALPAADLVKQNGDFTDPVIDHDLLPEDVLSAFADKHAAQIPLIIGTNSQEGSLLGNAQVDPKTLSPKLTNATLATLRTLYGGTTIDDTTLAKDIFRDGYFTGPTRFVARMSGAYLYRFSYVLTPLQTRRSGAWHGSEIPFIFKRWPINDLSDDDHRVESALHECWLAFAKLGKPDCANAMGWRTLNASGQEMIFDAHPSMRPPEDQPAVDLLQTMMSPLP